MVPFSPGHCELLQPETCKSGSAKQQVETGDGDPQSLSLPIQSMFEELTAQAEMLEKGGRPRSPVFFKASKGFHVAATFIAQEGKANLSAKVDSGVEDVSSEATSMDSLFRKASSVDYEEQKSVCRAGDTPQLAITVYDSDEEELAYKERAQQARHKRMLVKGEMKAMRKQEAEEEEAELEAAQEELALFKKRRGRL